ncbi:MAG: type II secretion system protein GspG [Planctomycetes bacterium]|nr:type II secretion system protein GspG [Planctomycetota bacterium]
MAEPVPQSRAGVWMLLGGLVGFATLVVFLLYHFVLGPGLMKNASRKRQAQAQSEILVLQAALERWSSQHEGKFPSSLEALVQPDAQGSTLLGDAFVVPKDPWGNEYSYAPPTPGSLRPTLLSLGHDGQPGGEDDDSDVDVRGALP